MRPLSKFWLAVFALLLPSGYAMADEGEKRWVGEVLSDIMTDGSNAARLRYFILDTQTGEIALAETQIVDDLTTLGSVLQKIGANDAALLAQTAQFKQPAAYEGLDGVPEGFFESRVLGSGEQ